MSEAVIRPTPTYTVHAGDSTRDRETVLSIWSGTLGKDSRHAAKFDWFYRRSPGMVPIVQLLRHEPSSTWVGTASAGARRMVWQGREIRAGVLVDMAVNARHRSLGPALTMQGALVQAAAKQFDVLYGFPNTLSLPVMKRLGYSMCCEMPRYTRVLRHHVYLSRHVPRFLARQLGWILDGLRNARSLRSVWAPRPRWFATWLDRVDPRMDELWSHSDHGNGLVGVRDTMFLRWRFDDMPGIRTRYLCLSESKGGALLAWFACQVDNGTLHVCDFWSRDAATGVGASIIEALVHAARREKHAAITLQFAAPPSKLKGWLASGFVERERRPVVLRWLASANAPDVVDYHLTAADEDE